MTIKNFHGETGLFVNDVHHKMGLLAPVFLPCRVIQIQTPLFTPT